LELRLDAVVFRSGLAPTIFAAKQIVNHRHILVNGRILDRASYRVKEGQVITINAEKSPKIAEIATGTNREVPSYLEVDRDALKVTVVREPDAAEIPVNAEVMRVIEYYAR
jgi:small subunit ribosomal protein S4